MFNKNLTKIIKKTAKKHFFGHPELEELALSAVEWEGSGRHSLFTSNNVRHFYFAWLFFK
jgi:hypothetical protein